jgi:phosphoribosylaminoimidazole-succinocarboxamide synthase
MTVSYNDIGKVIQAGLWPESKVITTKTGIPEVESLGYQLFYIGKNADLYFIPGEVPKMLMVRTDRTSVFDVSLDLEIPGKGEIQNQISLFGASFAKDFGINVLESDADIVAKFPENLQGRSQVLEMAKPIEFPFDGKTVGLELIYRNYLTGSLFKLYKNGENPYDLNLDSGMQEWDKFNNPIFTPTTKGAVDLPIQHKLVINEYPEIVWRLDELFKVFTKYAYEKGFVVVDTKFEVFIDSNGNWALGDEILTPESSRFITVENFEQGIYTSADKQIIRNVGLEWGWKDRAKSLMEGQVLHVEISEDVEEQVINGYNSIHLALVS